MMDKAVNKIKMIPPDPVPFIWRNAFSMKSNNNASRGINTIDIVYCGMFACLMAVGAFIKIMIPIGIWQVTFSLQFFFALLAGFLWDRAVPLSGG